MHKKIIELPNTVKLASIGSYQGAWKNKEPGSLAATNFGNFLVPVVLLNSEMQLFIFSWLYQPTYKQFGVIHKTYLVVGSRFLGVLLSAFEI